MATSLKKNNPGVFYELLEYKNKVDQMNSVLLDLAPSSFGLLKILGAQRATIFLDGILKSRK